MFDWAWTYWAPVTVFLYFNGALWVIHVLANEPIVLKGKHCKMCELAVVFLWPLVMPVSFALWLASKIKRNRTYI